MTRTRAIQVFFVLLLSAACAGAGPSEPLPAPPPPLPGTAGATTPEPRVDGGPDCDPCALLMEHDFDALSKGEACRICGEVDPSVCESWPPQGTTCATYDEYRNCIYARLGYGFETAPEWRTVFQRESWYQEDPAFTWDRVTPLQERNAHALRERVRRRRCSR